MRSLRTTAVRPEPLSAALDDTAPSLCVVNGPRGAGKSAMLRAALRGRRAFGFRAAPLPEPDLRARFRTALRRFLAEVGTAEADPPEGWQEMLMTVAEGAASAGEPWVVAIDDAHDWLSVGRGMVDVLERFWSAVRSRAAPVHLVLCGRSPDLLPVLERSDRLADAVGTEITLEPLGLREVASRFPDATPADRYRAWATFGGLPRRVALLDRDRSYRHNLRTLVLDPSAPLHDDGLRALEGDVQSLPRYASLLAALATGARDWGEIRGRCPDFGSGSQLAPYLGRLVELGLVEVRRSLDAEEGSRRRRYMLTDPFLGFWFGCVLPERSALGFGRDGAAEARVLDSLERHLTLQFPAACRRWLRDHAQERLPAPAREVGALWGAEHDLDVTGILGNGAPVYGLCHDSGAPADADLFDTVGRQLRLTRWGYGRETRHRVVFSRSGFTATARRRAAREDASHVVALEDLVETTPRESFPLFPP